ncbi:MAG TPA: ribonuclease H-like domain-containing protein [Sedimentisphaerales bacterium]|nr:ribonuclease H-like domain-containing protein [Sedimentisphaerales bacterium]
MICRAYLDIETTGLSRYYADLTVVGVCLEYGRQCKIIQLVGERITAGRVIAAVKKAEILYTYNGARFDLPFIKTKLGIDLTEYITHKDLMYDCWRQNLYGGLKVVEEKLAIARKTQGIDGRMAVRLWYEYQYYGNNKALALLLEYNREDVVNLTVLRRKLNG